MQDNTIAKFTEQWQKYFPGCELPIGFVYTDGKGGAESPSGATNCFVAELGAVRKGREISFSIDTIRCSGGKRYLGFTEELRENFEYFLSCGIEGELEGERYKKSPKLVSEYLKDQVPFQAPKSHITFKRLDQFNDKETPEVVIFFVNPDVLSGLFTLANFDSHDLDGVVTPFGSGCSSIVYYPYHEAGRIYPRAVVGMFDVSARPHVPAGLLTFAVPWRKFELMVKNIGESFLITDSWGKVRSRIGASH